MQPPPRENALVDPPGVTTVLPGKPTIPWTEWFEAAYDLLLLLGSGNLSPSKDVQTDSNGDLTSVDNTGTVNNVMSESPALTGSVTIDNKDVLKWAVLQS